jgi:GNAT superfamily N-acetyltransferase
VITYSTDASRVRADDLSPFFEGWPTPPGTGRRLDAMRGADHVVLAYEGDRLVGFATALTDGALMAAVPLVEVVATHRGRGIGAELVRHLVDALGDRYGIDLCCDEDVVGFYERLGFARVAGMVRRSPAALP